MQIQDIDSSQSSGMGDVDDAESNRPEYHEFTDQELKALVTSFGYKSRTNRSQKIGCLERLYDQRAAGISPQLTARTTATEVPPPTEEEEEEEEQAPSTMRQKIRDYITTDEALWSQIASYKAVDADQLQNKLEFSCTKDEVRAVLDEFAIFGKPARKRGTSKKRSK